jgi:hypothetical protein
MICRLSHRLVDDFCGNAATMFIFDAIVFLEQYAQLRDYGDGA